MTTQEIKESMHEQIKNLARRIIKIDDRVTQKKADIDDGDTNLFLETFWR
ncbi:Uncharacterised protein [Citrobacter youngae]|nr:hypothetical protein [Citrobacter youngae]VEI43580.1 Uncharacterised protein [Citrobacter youngae]